jgi:hypothetical protein
MNWNIKLAYFIKSLSKTPEGCYMPWWVRWAFFILMPGTMLSMMAANVYNPMNDVFTIFGHRFSGELFRRLAIDPTPGPWIRVIKRENGLIIVEETTKENDRWKKNS